jgi:hypothetical protein
MLNLHYDGLPVPDRCGLVLEDLRDTSVAWKYLRQNFPFNDAGRHLKVVQPALPTAFTRPASSQEEGELAVDGLKLDCRSCSGPWLHFLVLIIAPAISVYSTLLSKTNGAEAQEERHDDGTAVLTFISRSSS